MNVCSPIAALIQKGVRRVKGQLTLFLFISTIPVCQSQTSSVQLEVASIRPIFTPQRAGEPAGIKMSGPTVSASRVSLYGLITFAYERKGFEVRTLERWMKDDLYIIIARAEGDQALDRAQARLLMRDLLKQRFALEFHAESKELSCFRLTTEKGGAKLLLAKEGEESLLSFSSVRQAEILTVTRGSMGQLADHLSVNTDRPVVDDTGLKGEFDYRLSWTRNTSTTAGEDSGPSIFTALREQLGLRLEPGRAQFEILVVDRASHPSEN